MNGSILFGMAALLTLLLAAFFRSRRGSVTVVEEGVQFWLLLGVATLGSVALEVTAGGGVWRTGFSTTLWTIVASTMVVFFLLSLLSGPVQRLQPLLLPYPIVLAVIALLWSAGSDRPVAGSAMTAWLQVHIGVSLATYALITVAATAGLGVWLKERALRRRDASRWIEALPAIADGEKLQFRLLLVAEVILGVGLLSGVATQFFGTGVVIAFDHKTALSIAAFVVLGVLLILQRSNGLRGRHTTRLVLIIYLLITLAFPGVKFVTDVVLS